MPQLDPATGDVSNVAYAADTTAAQGGEPDSIFDSIGNVVSKGIPLTGMAAFNSIANTAVDVGNWFTNGSTERYSVEKEIPDLESATGQDGLNDYYKEHQQGIELAGLVAGSIIPGGLAVKALKAAQAAEASTILARATGIFSAPKAALIAQAEQELTLGDAGLYGSLNASKLKAIAYGVGDQALQALVYQTASIATQKASPLLDDKGWDGIGKDMLYGTLTGAGFGGLLEGIGTRQIFNRMIVNADVGTKSAEIMKLYGGINLFPGDRVAELVNSIDSIPAQTTALGAKKLSITTDAAVLNAKKIIGSMVGPGDEDVGNALVDTIFKMRQTGGLDKEDLYSLMGRLAKVSRIGTPPSVQSGDAFFVNRFTDLENAQWNDLVTDSPSASATFSQKYQLKPFSNDVSIARGSDKVSDLDGLKSTPAYDTAEDAWADGHDMFIKGGRVFVNPNAPNIEQIALGGYNRILSQAEAKAYADTGSLPDGSKPLMAAPLVLNRLTGGISSDAVPVVGDFGKVMQLDKGLQYGDKFSPQTINTPLTAETSAIDSNARYVWAAQRGVKFGDTIAPTDIPMLEQLYRQSKTSKQSFSDYMGYLEQRGVQFSDEDLPASSDQLLSMIQKEKTNLIIDLMDKNPKMGSEELAVRANVPEKFIENNFQAKAPEDYMVDPAQHTQVNHVQLEYDVSHQTVQQGQILRGMQDVMYRVQLGVQVAQARLAAFAGKDFDQFISRFGSDKANILGSGGKFLGSANGNYDTLAQEMERIGSLVTQLANQRLGGVSRILAPVANSLRADQQASAELGMFIGVRQRSGAKYAFLPPELAQKYGMSEDTAVITDSFKRDKGGNIIDWDKDYVPDNFLDGSQLDATATVAAGGTPKEGQYTYYGLSPKVAAWERAQQQINDARLVERNAWYTAQGLDRRIETGTLYAPPIDTSKYRHFAYVRTTPGYMMGDDNVSIITAASEEELRNTIGKLDPSLSVFTKDQLAELHASGGDYQFQRNFTANRIDSSLARKGVLNNIFPDTRAETIIQNYLNWNAKQELSLVRDHVELGNSQLFAELEQMGKRFISPATSQFGRVSPYVIKLADNPYDRYIKSALAIGNKEQYPLWQYAQEKLQAFGDTAFNAARYAFGAAKRGLVSYEDAAATAAKFGLGAPYEKAANALSAYTDIANKLPDPRALSRIVAVGNSVIGTSIIRLDTFQQIIHMASTPILLAGEAMSATKELMGLTTTAIPGSAGRTIPSVSKLYFSAVRNFFDKATTDKWMPVYDKLGVNRNDLTTHMNMIEDLALPLGGKVRDVQKWIQGVTDKAATISGANFSQSFIHFITADVGRQLFEAGGYEGKALLAQIQTFSNRVQGNYIASQRPVAFQGPLGQAIGLFQTYYFNFMQQVMRYVGNGDAKIAASVAGLNSTIFGLQSFPGFHILNNYIIGNLPTNPGHADVYSTVAGRPGGFFDRDLGNFIMYGSLSNILGAGLYSRGDLNPRSTSVLPLNPMEYPAVSGAVQFAGALWDMSRRIAQGGDPKTSMLIGMEHNGLSRPLSGLAQLIQGYSTTAQGSLISVNNRALDTTGGYSDLFNMANFSRLLGARPIDEAITMDTQYRSTLYQAVNTARMQSLGSAVKSTMIGGKAPTQDQLENFATEYAAAGGDIKSFGRSMIGWANASSASVANKVFRTQSQSPLHQQMQRAMGGVPLPDFTNSGSTAGSGTGTIWNGSGEAEEGTDSTGGTSQ